MDLAIFFARIRASLFGGRLSTAQVEGIERILDKGAELGVPADYMAYILATAHHETGRRMVPVRETFAASDKAAAATLEAAWKRGQLPWVKTPYWRADAEGKYWFGRGLPQATHKANYARMGDILGIDFVADPDLMLDPEIAVAVMFEGMLPGLSGKGDFTGVSLDDFLAGPKEDLVGARRVINGVESKDLVASYAKAYLAALTAAGWTGRPDEPVVTPPPESTSAAPAEPPGLAAALADVRAALDRLAAIVGA